jgi:integrase/recombinase XerD
MYMQSLNVSDSTYNNRLASISSLYKILSYNPSTEDLVTFNPTFGVTRVSVKNKEKVPLTEDEKKYLLQNCKNSRDYAILSLMLSTGIRIHELIALTLKQYENRDKNDGVELFVTKRSHNRTIWLNEETVKAIETYLKDRKQGCDKLFVSNGHEDMCRTSISRTIRNIARRSGMFTEDRISQLCNHLMRTTYCSDLVNSGVSVAVAQKILGHINPSTTLKYYVKIADENVINAMKGFSI